MQAQLQQLRSLPRYANNQNQLKVDIILALLGLGLVISFWKGNWVDYLTIVPAFMRSMRAIDTDDTRDDTFWCKYWLIFALVKILFDHLLSPLKHLSPHTWLPILASLVRVGFFYYCGSYKYQGATTVYDFLRPYLLDYLPAELRALAQATVNIANNPPLPPPVATTVAATTH